MEEGERLIESALPSDNIECLDGVASDASESPGVNEPRMLKRRLDSPSCCPPSPVTSLHEVMLMLRL